MHVTQFVHCFVCRHFYITYDSNFPYGCRALGFKSKRLPCIEVEESSEMECAYFERKRRKQP
ncbi:MAG TPA: uracil-DNA glycosylase [Deltaproteobacteria bacterium]|nr:uracil-DNA glycosylase [Deltaproteobacteria bacterium]